MRENDQVTEMNESYMQAFLRKDRDKWQQQSKIQEAKAAVYKFLFAVSLALNLVGWFQ
jgi:hypothetical protein